MARSPQPWRYPTTQDRKALPEALAGLAEAFPVPFVTRRFAYSEFGALLVKHIADQGLTHTQVRKQMNPPMSASHFSHLLDHELNVSYERLDQLATILNLTPEQFEELDAADNRDRRNHRAKLGRRQTPQPTHFGRMLEELLMDKGHLKKELAELLNVSQASMTYILGKSYFSQQRLEQIAHSLELTSIQKRRLYEAYVADRMETK